MLAFIRNDGSAILPNRDTSPEPETMELTLLANTYVEAKGQTVSQQMDLGIIDDTSLFNLPAAPWTTVTDDNEMVSHLLSSFATWDANTLHFFDMDIFLEGMEKENHSFCSPLLANSVLAIACHFSNRIAIRSDPHNPNTLGYRFLQEAMKIWHHEHDNLTLTNVQAGLILSEVVSVNGMDNFGWMLFQTAADLLQRFLAELELSKASFASEKRKASAPLDAHGDNINEKKMEREISATVWATFRLSW
ncbi:hypothetical protein TWF506_000255 [Arthrobotrys conoides]|uniref:Xylanolytic transcriptional activator regulatory domain-containing protein n=1 Tax=Arthrobotrys conoides TaxID=74498 RepID=A0AAN8RXD9_9PEZI